MPPISIKDLQEQRRKYLALEKQWRKTEGQLLDLPKRLGFDSIKSLIQALRRVSSAKGASKRSIVSSRRKRTTITPQIEEHVRKLLLEGHTSASVAAAIKISVPSVSNLKKRFGLVKRSKTKRNNATKT